MSSKYQSLRQVVRNTFIVILVGCLAGPAAAENTVSIEFSGAADSFKVE